MGGRGGGSGMKKKLGGGGGGISQAAKQESEYYQNNIHWFVEYGFKPKYFENFKDGSWKQQEWATSLRIKEVERILSENDKFSRDAKAMKEAKEAMGWKTTKSDPTKLARVTKEYQDAERSFANSMSQNKVEYARTKHAIEYGNSRSSASDWIDSRNDSFDKKMRRYDKWLKEKGYL